MAGVYGWRQATHIGRIIREITGAEHGPMTFFIDNQAAITVAETGNFNSARSKHIEVKFHKLAEIVESKQAKVKYVKSELNPADLLTKPIKRAMAEKLLHKIVSDPFGTNQ